MNNRPLSYARGVTLIELMVVVVVIGILTSIALPSYRSYMVRTNRTEAQWQLLKIAAAQEQFYLQWNTYATDTQLTAAPPAGLGIARNGQMGNYRVRIEAGADATGFRATAAPIGGQKVDDADCEIYGINEAGSRYGGKRPLYSTANNPRCWGGGG